MLLVADHGIEVYIFHAAENVALYVWVRLFHLGDHFFDLHAFGDARAVRTAGRARIGKAAGALDEVQIIVIPPVDDVGLADQVHRADDLHSIKMDAVQLWHHRLDLCAVEHAHEVCLDHIVVVMAECDLIAAQIHCPAVQVAAAHAGAEIARGFVDVVDGIEDLCLENGGRDAEHAGVFLDDLPVGCIIARIHDEIDDLEREFIVALQLLKQLCHEHGVLAAGDTDCDLIVFLDQLIVADRLCKAGEERHMEFAPDAVFDALLAGQPGFFFFFFTFIRRIAC